MKRWARAILTPPRFDDEDRQRSAHVVNVALVTLLVAAIAFLPLTIGTGDHAATAAISVSLVAVVVCLSIFRRHHNLRIPSLGVPLVVLVLATFLIVKGLGVHDITILLYPLVIILGGLLLGARGTVVFAGLCMVALTGVFFADRGGFIADSVPGQTGLEDLVMLYFFMVLTAAMMIYNQGLVTSSLHRIRESERNLASAQAIAHVGSWRWRLGDAQARWSDELYRVLDLRPGSVEPTLGSFVKRVHPEDREDVRRALRDLVDGRERVVRLELRVLHANGEQHFVEADAEMALDDDGSTPVMVGVLHDVTDRLLAERETELLQEQLAQSQKMEAIGMLAGGVAHDFNNILTTIVGSCDLLAIEPDLEPSVRRGIREIQDAADRATSLTQQLLAFSRKQLLEPDVLDLNALITRFETILRRLIGEDVSLNLSLDPTIGRVTADPSQLEQVMLNLAVNARDAMPTGGVLSIETQSFHLDELYCEDHPDVEPGDYVLFAVSDTGVGLDDETRARLFDPFFTTKERGRGTGLGLATVYGVVKQSGGHIWVYSELGHGTSFKIYLPEVREAIDEVPRVVHPREAYVGTETILLVEDDPSVRNMLASGLRGLGYTVHEAGDGEEALELIEQGQLGAIDVLVTDVILPGASGADLVRAVRRVVESIEVLFISGYTESAIEQHGVLDESVFFLQKPFSPVSLAQKLREIISAS